VCEVFEIGCDWEEVGIEFLTPSSRDLLRIDVQFVRLEDLEEELAQVSRMHEMDGRLEEMYHLVIVGSPLNHGDVLFLRIFAKSVMVRECMITYSKYLRRHAEVRVDFVCLLQKISER